MTAILLTGTLMFIRMRCKLLICLVICFFCSVKTVAANNQFISIVNPVRISVYNPNLAASLKSQYAQVSSWHLPATWLLTYDVLHNPEAIAEIKKFNSDQEVGLFLEVTKSSAAANGFVFNEIGSWHFAASVFLSGYSQFDRKKFIDSQFSKYKELFGKYPTSVGSWWTDSFSLSYMKEKYGITANLACADQFSTDGYQIWGTYWSTPYYPSKNHTGIPAASASNKLDLVVTQWAPREPLAGYFDSKYSTQDYFTEPKKDITYFRDLLNLYASAHANKFGHITIGLEGDFLPDTYQDIYASQLGTAIAEAKKNHYEFLTMARFSDWYRHEFPDVSPSQTITSSSAVWYNSPFYRLGYKKDSATGEITIFDLRIYSDQTQEPYYESANPSKYLEINIPSAIDSMTHLTREWKLPPGSEIKLSEKELTISTSKLTVPNTVANRPGVTVKKDSNQTTLGFSGTPLGTGKGEQIQGWSVEAKHFFSQKKFPLLLLTGRGWNYFKKATYTISQDEREALFLLSQLPSGTVLTPDYECLQCRHDTALIPAMYANERSYITQFAQKKVVKNNTVFTASTREDSKNAFEKTRAKYVYLTKLTGYQEKLPFSPGDLDLELVYANANAEVWQKN